MKEQFNREAKEGWRFAADAARITDENAGTEECKHTSGGVFVAVSVWTARSRRVCRSRVRCRTGCWSHGEKHRFAEEVKSLADATQVLQIGDRRS